MPARSTRLATDIASAVHCSPKLTRITEPATDDQNTGETWCLSPTLACSRAPDRQNSRIAFSASRRLGAAARCARRILHLYSQGGCLRLTWMYASSFASRSPRRRGAGAADLSRCRGMAHAPINDASNANKGSLGPRGGEGSGTLLALYGKAGRITRALLPRAGRCSMVRRWKS